MLRNGYQIDNGVTNSINSCSEKKVIIENKSVLTLIAREIADFFKLLQSLAS